METEFDFYPGMDSVGYDIMHYNTNMTISKLMNLCIKDSKCIGFNTLGYMKHRISPVDKFDCDNKYPQNTAIVHGLYVHRTRYKRGQEIDTDFIFHPKMDSCGYDICQYPNKSILELQQLCKSIPECIGFNTGGWMKYKIGETSYVKSYKNRSDGLYIYKNASLLPCDITCINLEHRSDRRAHVNLELTKFPELHRDRLKFFDAVDGKKLLPTSELRELFLDNNFCSRRAVVGCALSHYTLWKIIAHDTKPTLVLEDDIYLANSFDTNLKDVLRIAKREHPDIDCIYLGFHHYLNIIQNNWNTYRGQSYGLALDDKAPFRGDNREIRISEMDTDIVGGAFGYILYPRGAQKLCDYIAKNGIRQPIDDLLIKLGILNQKQVLPHIIYSTFVDGSQDADSDIQKDGIRLFIEDDTPTTPYITRNIKLPVTVYAIWENDERDRMRTEFWNQGITEYTETKESIDDLLRRDESCLIIQGVHNLCTNFKSKICESISDPGQIITFGDAIILYQHSTTTVYQLFTNQENKILLKIS